MKRYSRKQKKMPTRRILLKAPSRTSQGPLGNDRVPKIFGNREHEIVRYTSWSAWMGPGFSDSEPEETTPSFIPFVIKNSWELTPATAEILQPIEAAFVESSKVNWSVTTERPGQESECESITEWRSPIPFEFRRGVGEKIRTNISILHGKIVGYMAAL